MPGDAGRLRKALSSHGSGFHYAVINAISTLSDDRGLGWKFVAAEVPVVLAGQETHADFIFEDDRGHVLVGECKRVDPSYSEWLFARSMFVAGRDRAPASIDELHIADNIVHIGPKILTSARTYQVGLTIKKALSGEATYSDKNAISAAAAQVTRAIGGFAEICRDNPGLLRPDFQGRNQLIPAVFTTAMLTTCDHELALSELATGKVLDSVGFADAEWIWLQHALTPSMRAALPGRYLAEQMRTWPDYFRRAAFRSVAIVTVAGIASFLEAVQEI